MSLLQQKLDSLAKLVPARDAIGAGAQEYSIEGNGGGRKVRKADFPALCAEIRELEAEVSRLKAASTRRVLYIR